MDSEKHKGKHKHDEESAENDMGSEKHKGKHKDKESAEKTTNAEQDNTTGTASTANSDPQAADGDLFGKGIVGRKPTDITPVNSGAVSGPAAVNTIYPIASPPPRVVTISVGEGSFQIPDGPGGVIVSSTSPGTLTISNGHNSRTVGAGSLTLSGTLGVGRGPGVQVGPTNGEGKTVIAVTPPPPAPLPHPGTVTNTSAMDDIGKAVGGAFGVVFDPFF